MNRDLDRILDIYTNAKKFMNQNNNPNQWAANYPHRNLLVEDIRLGQSYICIQQDEIIGTFCFYQENDPCYSKIEEGSWLNADPYGVIHRIATVTHQYGVGGFCVDYCKTKSENIRIDTYKENIIMQNFLVKHGFIHCGTIYLADGDSRMAYHYAK